MKPLWYIQQDKLQIQHWLIILLNNYCINIWIMIHDAFKLLCNCPEIGILSQFLTSLQPLILHLMALLFVTAPVSAVPYIVSD